MTQENGEIQLEVHLANKRESYDGMRAYHGYELIQLKNSLDMLRAVLTTTVLLYGGLIGLLLSNKMHVSTALIFAITSAICISLAVISIIVVSVRQLSSTLSQYQKYREEYVMERSIIGLESALIGEGYTSCWVQEYDQCKTGSNDTKNLLYIFGGIVVFVAFVGCIGVFGVYLG